MNYNWTDVGKAKLDNLENLLLQREEQKNVVI